MNKTCVDRNRNGRATAPMATLLLATTILAGLPGIAMAQTADAPAAAPAAETIQSITVVGAQRLEPDTIRTYIKLRVGQP